MCGKSEKQWEISLRSYESICSSTISFIIIAKKNKDENVHRYAVRGVKKERGRETVTEISDRKR